MDIAASINLTKDESQELAKILDCGQDELAERLKAYATAALAEHVHMFLGQKVFTRGSDLLEYRLLLLILGPFGSRIPDEQEVCRLFQTTATGARSLIRAVMSKYQYQLRDAIDGSLSDLLDSAQFDEEFTKATVAVHNVNLVEELNRQLMGIDTNLPPVQKMKNSVSTYEIRPSSYDELCKVFGVASKLPE